jgi:hypothetical protein
MSKLRRSIVMLASAIAISSGALIVTAQAADQASPPTGAQPAQGPQQPVSGARSTPAPSASNAAANPATAKPTAPATKPPAPGAPQVPEESATIRDDPTIAPDPKQSADKSVSFPNDI